MPSKNPAQRLSDIVDNIGMIEAFTAKMDRAAFAADRKTLYAVVRAWKSCRKHRDGCRQN